MKFEEWNELVRQNSEKREDTSAPADAADVLTEAGTLADAGEVQKAAPADVLTEAGALANAAEVQKAASADVLAEAGALADAEEVQKTAPADVHVENAASTVQTAAPAGAAEVQAAKPAESAEGEADPAAHEESGQPKTVTYSWVNPKLQTERSSRGTYGTEDSGKREEAPNTWQWKDSSSQTDSGQRAGRQNTAYGFGQNQNREMGQKGSDTYRSAQSPERDRRSKKRGSGMKKPASSGKKWMRTVAAALVFGLIAGTTMFGVNRAGTAIFGSSGKADTAKTQSYAKIATTSTTDGGTSELAKNLDDSTRTEGEKAYAGSVAEVAANAMPSLVTISTMSVQEMQSFFGGTQQYEVEGAGTGVIVGQNDTELLIATNNHVIEGATEVTVGFVDEQVVEAFVKGADSQNDLAVVGVKLSDIPEETMNQIKVVAIGNSDDLMLGEQVVAIGNALGYGQSVTSGYISAFDRDLELSDGMSSFTSSGLIQTDAAINSGNSGGALLNMRGELIGINEAKVSGSGGGASVDNVGYSIPISKAEPILEELMNLETKEKVAEDEKGYLGIRCADVNQETSERYNIPVGVYVREIAKDSPAGEAGLVVGDVITKLDGKIISEYADLEAALNYCKAGETVEVIIQHQENGTYTEKELSVTLDKAEVLERLENTEEPQRNMQMDPYGD